jgi:apolipoprotein D and lipocalin family protein
LIESLRLRSGKDAPTFRLRCVLLVLLGLLVEGCTGGTQPPLPLAKDVDLNRMMGPWYLIATIPNWFEKGMVAPYDVYSFRPDGDIREDFTVREGSFEAVPKHFTVHDWAEPNSGNARWRVRIISWPLDLPFLLLYVDPGYQFALFGEESRDLGWIYARKQEIRRRPIGSCSSGSRR